MIDTPKRQEEWNEGIYLAPEQRGIQYLRNITDNNGDWKNPRSSKSIPAQKTLFHYNTVAWPITFKNVVVRSKGKHIPDERRILSAYVIFNIYATLLYNFLS